MMKVSQASEAENHVVMHGPQLLNCQTQSHLSWLIVISPWGKKSLVREFGAGGDFHPFRV